MTTLVLHYRAVKHKVQSLSLPVSYFKKISIVAFLILSLLLVFYIFQINRLTTGSYMIKNYQKQIQTLSLENNTLQADVAQDSFLGNVKEKALSLNFEKITKVTYIQILDSSIAKAGQVK